MNLLEAEEHKHEIVRIMVWFHGDMVGAFARYVVEALAVLTNVRLACISANRWCSLEFCRCWRVCDLKASTDDPRLYVAND